MTFPIVAYLDSMPLRGRIDPTIPTTRLGIRLGKYIPLDWSPTITPIWASRVGSCYTLSATRRYRWSRVRSCSSDGPI
jgi:hypothetical protein